MYKILLISTILILALGVAPVDPACSIPVGGTLKSKSYTATSTEFDTTWEILSSLVIPSNVPAEAAAGLYYSTVVMRKGNTLKIQSVNANFDKFIQTYTPTCAFEVADIFGNTIAVNEYTNNDLTSSPVIAFYFFNHNTPQATTLSRTVGSPYGGSGWKAVALVEMGSTADGFPFVFVLLQRGTVSQWNAKGLSSNGGFDNGGSSYPVQNHLVHFGGGNHRCHYDKTLNIFYRVNNDAGTWQTLVPGNGYGNVTFLTNVVYHRINARAFAFSSNSADHSEYHLGIYAQIQQGNNKTFEGLVLTGQTAPVMTYGDSYKNLVVSSATDTIWYQCTNSASFFKTSLSTAVTDTTIRAQAIAAFQNALSVSFNADKVFVLGASSVLIYTIDSTAGTVTKSSSVDLSSSFIDVMESEKPLVITATIACDCVSKSIVTFACFSLNENCYAITSFSESDCTTPPPSK